MLSLYIFQVRDERKPFFSGSKSKRYHKIYVCYILDSRGLADTRWSGQFPSRSISIGLCPSLPNVPHYHLRKTLFHEREERFSFNLSTFTFLVKSRSSNLLLTYSFLNEKNGLLIEFLKCKLQVLSTFTGTNGGCGVTKIILRWSVQGYNKNVPVENVQQECSSGGYRVTTRIFQ
jgi:hypothetical protein